MMTRVRAGEVSKAEIVELIDLLHDFDHENKEVVADAWEERHFQLTGTYLHDKSPEAIEKRRKWFAFMDGGLNG